MGAQHRVWCKGKNLPVAPWDKAEFAITEYREFALFWNKALQTRFFFYSTTINRFKTGKA